MANELYLHTLRQLRDGCKAERMDTETAALDAAIKALNGGGDCISRQAAIDALDKIFDNIPMEQTTEILTLRRALRELPSAQPEIIRCKDCSKWQTIDCPFFSKYITVMPNEEQYCSLAERRTDEQIW